MAPLAVEVAPFEEHRRSYPGTVDERVPLYVKNSRFHIFQSFIWILRFGSQYRPELRR